MKKKIALCVLVFMIVGYCFLKAGMDGAVFKNWRKLDNSWVAYERTRKNIFGIKIQEDILGIRVIFISNVGGRLNCKYETYDYSGKIFSSGKMMMDPKDDVSGKRKASDYVLFFNSVMDDKAVLVELRKDLTLVIHRDGGEDWIMSPESLDALGLAIERPVSVVAPEEP